LAGEVGTDIDGGSGKTSNSFQPVIDGTPGARFDVNSGSDQTVTLASNLGDSDHVVELYRETEGMDGLCTILGFTAGTVRGCACAGCERADGRDPEAATSGQAGLVRCTG
jgi:hypothetical protein